MINKWKERIVINPKILVGKPIIKGTRISVSFLLELLAHGWITEKILKNYPQLKKEDLQAVLNYSAHRIKMKSIYPL